MDLTSLTTATSTALSKKNATVVTALTIIRCYADAKDPSNHPMMPEVQSTQADHPGVPDQGAHKMISTGQAEPPTNITDAPPAVVLPATLPTVLAPTNLPTSPLDTALDGAPPSNATRTALKSPQHPQLTASRPLPTPKKAPC